MRSLLLFPLIFCYTLASAQSLLWLNQLTGPGSGDGRACKVAPNGNIYLGGSFTGTIDLDPSPSVYNITSKGQRDIFLACYNSSGKFLWGFGIGASENDLVKNIAFDKNNDVIVVGQYREYGVDFDPGAGISNLNANGSADGFVALYNSSGNFIWAHTIGGTSEFDDAQSAASDQEGNIYVGGDFHKVMDIDPDPSMNVYLNSSTGTAFLIKYTASGQLVWGFNFGGGGSSGVDNSVWDMEYGNNGFLYLTGCYTGTSDFDPSPSNAILIANGAFDGYVAKYNTDGVYQDATDIKGPGIEQAIDIALDAAKNIYIIGYTESATIKFSQSSGPVARPAGSDKSNVFIASYKNSGQLQWGQIVGGKKVDFGWGIEVANGFVYCSGYFADTVDFDASPAIAELKSNGENDIFLARYDLQGNYICGFNIGGTKDDNAYKVTADKSGALYISGFISSAMVDFTPFSATYNASATGGSDICLAKYSWANTYNPPSGYLVGDTVCEGDEAFLKFIATAGTGPFSITYSDGTIVYTQSGLESGQSFKVPGHMAKTTTYVLTVVKDASPCTPPGYPNAKASILVYLRPVADAGADTMVCPGATIVLHGSGGISYRWLPAAGLSDSLAAAPSVTIQTDIQYYLVATNEYGCTDTDMVSVSLVPADFKVKELNDVCIGDTVQLQASGGMRYEWTPVDSLYPANSPLPYVWPRQSRSYWVTIMDTLCGRQQTLEAKVFVHTLPDVQIITAKDVDCGRKFGQLAATGAIQYSWTPSDMLSNPEGSATYARPAENTIYTVTGTDQFGCSNTDTALIKVFEGMGRLFAPDAFTPNNDGLNDCYRVFIPGDVSGFELSIYDRWGQRVFLTRDISGCWDGTYNGSDAEIGTYFYFYKAVSSICDELFIKGSFQLVK